MDLWFIRSHTQHSSSPRLRLIAHDDVVVVCEDATFDYLELKQQITAQVFAHAEHTQLRGIALSPEQTISTTMIAELIPQAERCITL